NPYHIPSNLVHDMDPYNLHDAMLERQTDLRISQLLVICTLVALGVLLNRHDLTDFHQNLSQMIVLGGMHASSPFVVMILSLILYHQPEAYALNIESASAFLQLQEKSCLDF